MDLARHPPRAFTDPRRASLSRVAIGIGYLLAAVSLVWVFHDVDPRALARDAASIRWPWVVLAVACDVVGYVCQGLRWWLLLPRERRPSVVRTTQAIYAGLCTNELFPARPGELARAFLVSRWTGGPFARVLSSILVERLLDGIWLAIGVALVAALIPLPVYLVKAEEMLVVVVATSAAILLALLWRARRVGATRNASSESGPGSAALRGWRAFLARRAGAVALRDVAPAFAVSSLVPCFEAAALWCVMRAYGIPLSIAAGIAVLLIVRLGTALPGAPGNLGTYQLLCVVGVSLFGVDKSTATSFSIGAFVLLTLPLLLLGFLALGRSGTTLAGLRLEIEALLRRRTEADGS